MKDLIGKLLKKKDHYSSTSLSLPRYSKICDENDQHQPHSPRRRGFVPVTVGKFDEEERLMVPTKCMSHPSIVTLLQLSANEFGYHQQGVLHIPCEPDFFRETLAKVSSKKK